MIFVHRRGGSSSSLANKKSYAPAFVYLGVEVAFIAPGFYALFTRLHKTATPATWWFFFLDNVLPTHLKPLTSSNIRVSLSHINQPPARAAADSSQHPPHFRSGVSPAGGGVDGGHLVADRHQPAHHGQVHVRGTGAAEGNPVGLRNVPVGELGAAEESSKLDSTDPSCLNVWERYFAELEVKSRAFHRLHVDKLHVSVWIIACHCFGFYAMFLFDTLGDAVGFSSALWVFIATPLIPVGMYVIYTLFRTKQHWLGSTPSVDGSTEKEDAAQIELSTHTANPLLLQQFRL